MSATASTGEVGAAQPRDEIIKEAKRIEESTLLSSKAHFAASHRWGLCHLIVGVVVSVLSAVAAAFTFSARWPEAVGTLALVVTILSAVSTFLNPNERAAKHLASGNGYDSLSNRARIFATIDCWADGADARDLTERLKRLADEKSKLNAESLQISPWDYRKAKRGVAAGEGAYAVDKPQQPSA